jgi:hypothetical protein
MDLKVCAPNNNVALIEKFEKESITPHVHELIQKTKHLKRIPRYFIITAVLSHRFKLSFQETLSSWNKEVEEVKSIHESIHKLDIPRLYKCGRFALHVLKHLLIRGGKQTVCSYSYGARNFIVALAKTNQCLCASYTLYVEAMVEEFGYDDYITTCSIPGHIFTVTKENNQAELEPLIGFDAGYPHNDHIKIRYWKHKPSSEVETMLGWDKVFFKWDKDAECESCEQSISRSANNKFQNLLIEAQSSKNYEKSIRNLLILSYLTPNKPYLREYVKLQLETTSYYLNTFSKNPTLRSSIETQKQNREQLKLCLSMDKANSELWRTNVSYSNPEFSASYLLYMMFETEFGDFFDSSSVLPAKCNFLFTILKDMLQSVENSHARLSSHMKENEFGVQGQIEGTVVVKHDVEITKSFCVVHKVHLTQIEDMFLYPKSTIMYSSTMFRVRKEFDVIFKPNEDMPPEFIVIYYDRSKVDTTFLLPLNAILRVNKQKQVQNGWVSFWTSLKPIIWNSATYIDKLLPGPLDLMNGIPTDSISSQLKLGKSQSLPPKPIQKPSPKNNQKPNQKTNQKKSQYNLRSCQKKV